MFKDIQAILDRINSERRSYKTWQKVVSVLACLTIFCTVYALILPAITLEASPDAICGKEEHTHTAECYARKPVLVCTEDHEHTDVCYVVESVLICGQEEHAHTAVCFPKEEPKVEEKVEAPTESVAPSDLPASSEEEVKDEVKTADEGDEKDIADEVKKDEDKKADETEKKVEEVEKTDDTQKVEEAEKTDDSQKGEETEKTEEDQKPEEPDDAQSQEDEQEEELPEYQSRTVIGRAGLIRPKMMKTESESPMQLKKTVSSEPNADGYYTITLEAYAKGSGSIEIHTSVAPTDIVLVLDQSGSMDDTIDGTKKYKILQNAVKNFIDQVIASVKGSDGELGSDDDVAHRIAMVGFSGSNSDYTGVFLKSKKHKIKKMSIMTTNDYKNAFYDMTDDDDREDIYTAKNNIGVDAATYINLGMQMAKKIFDNNKDSTRNRLVVVFTDGVPGASRSGGWYYNPVDDQQDSGKNAEAAIAMSNQLKSNYKATVYSIGIFAGADASQNGTMWDDSTWTFTEAQAAPYANYFMHHLSSNYNSSGSQVDTRFYKSASNAGDLINAFETIAESVQTGGSQSTELKENTTVIDAVSDFFEFPEGGDLTNVKVFTVDSNELDGSHNPKFDNSTKTEIAATVSKSSDGKSISVKGFDFSDNWCGYIKEGDNYKVHPGKKMVIEIPIKPKEDFIGGFGVPTNSSNSGVYLNVDGSLKEVGKFDVPTTDVPPKFTINTADKTVYASSGTELSLNDLFTGGVIAKAKKMKDFVEAHPVSGTKYEFDIPTGDVNTNASGDYTMSVKVTNKNNASDSRNIDETKTAHVYVLVPEITWKDTRVFSSEHYNHDICLSKNKVSERWVPDKSGLGDIPAATGDAPELTYSFVDSNGNAIASDYVVYDETRVDVNVSTSSMNATEFTKLVKFKWETCTDHGNSSLITTPHGGNDASEEFYIHAKIGTALPATGGSGLKIWLVIGLTLMTSPVMIGLSIKRRLALIKTF